MKTWMKVVLGIVAGIALFVALIFWLTSDIAQTGDDFFAAVQNDDIDAAYDLLSTEFQAGTTKDGLRSYLADNGFDSITEISWGARSFENNLGSLEGTIETENGGTVPLSLRLVNEADGWRIMSIRTETAGFQGGTNDNPVPDEATQMRLTRETVSIFAQSLSDSDMTKLYDHASATWQQQTTAAELGEAFKSFYQYAPGYTNLARLEPELDSAAIDEDTEILTIRFHYPVNPSAVHFRTTYIYEGTDWELFGLELKVGSAPGSQPTNETGTRPTKG